MHQVTTKSRRVGGGVSDVIGRGPFAFTSRQREGRLALRLREATGELGEGFDERAALGDAHLPQLHLLASCPLLRSLEVYLTTLPQVGFIPQHYDHHLHPEHTWSQFLVMYSIAQSSEERKQINETCLTQARVKSKAITPQLMHLPH